MRELATWASFNMPLGTYVGPNGYILIKVGEYSEWLMGNVSTGSIMIIDL